MKCPLCRELLSGFIEKSLAPSTLEAAAAHLASCGPCREELRGLQKAVQVLRAAPLEEPPTGLLEAILERAPFAVAAGHASRKTKVRSLVAALLLAVLSLALVLALRELRSSAREDALTAAARRNALEAERSLALVEEERARLSREVEAALARERETARGAQEARQLAEANRIALEESRTKLSTEIQRIEEAARVQAAEVAELKARLALAVTPERPAPAGQEPEPPDTKGTDEPEAPPSRARGVVVLAHGDQLELRVRGNLDEVVPELLAMAADEGKRDVSDLALGALENLLDPSDADRSAASGSRGQAGPPDPSWWDRRLQGFTNAFSAAETPLPEANSASSSRRARLEALEAAWRRRSAER